MTSFRFFSSNNEQYIINMDINTTLFKRHNRKLELMMPLGKLKNPYFACFSPDDSKVLVQNNNALIEIYHCDSFKKIARFRGMKDSKFIFFIDNEHLIFTTTTGKLYTLDLSSNHYLLHFDNSYVSDGNLYRLKTNEFIFTAYHYVDQATHIHHVKTAFGSLEIDFLTKIYGKIQPQGMTQYQNRIFFVDDDQHLWSVLLDEPDSNMAENWFNFDDRRLIVLMKAYCSEMMETFPILEEIFMGKIVFKNISAYKHYLLVTFDGGLIVLDAKTKAMAQVVPSDRGIENMLITQNDGYVWLSSGWGSAVCTFDDLLNGQFKPYLPEI